MIIKAVPHSSARRPPLKTIRLMWLIDCSAGSRDFRTTNCSGEEAVVDRSSVAARKRVSPSFTLAGVGGFPASDKNCVAKLVCNEGVRVLATIFPLLTNVASTPAG